MRGHLSTTIPYPALIILDAYVAKSGLSRAAYLRRMVEDHVGYEGDTRSEARIAPATWDEKIRDVGFRETIKHVRAYAKARLNRSGWTMGSLLLVDAQTWCEAQGVPSPGRSTLYEILRHVKGMEVKRTAQGLMFSVAIIDSCEGTAFSSVPQLSDASPAVEAPAPAPVPAEAAAADAPALDSTTPVEHTTPLPPQTPPAAAPEPSGTTDDPADEGELLLALL